MATVKILYFSVNEWGNMGRRKPRLAHEFAQRPEVASVLYVQPPVSTSILDLARGRLASEYLDSNRSAHLQALLGRSRQVEERLWIYTGSTKTIPLTRFKSVRRMKSLQRLNQSLYHAGIRRAVRRLSGERLVLWLSHPLHAGTLKAFPQRALACYDWTDDWSAFDILCVEDPDELVALNDYVLRNVDLVLAVSTDLEQRATILASHTYRMPNATDPAALGGAATDGQTASELSSLSRPIIGYLGQVGDKLDYDLIEQLARSRPSWSFVFVGPVWPSKQEQVGALERLDNVHFLGGRPFDELVPYLRGFDVCTLPHVVTPLTRSMDPIKLYDYMATGKPIVSTPVAGVNRFDDIVSVCDGPAAFLRGLEAAIAEDSDLRQRRLAHAQQNTWSKRASEIWEVLECHIECQQRKRCETDRLS
jgi:glycosyltransferase involved in cell wall biosynthesis